METLSEEYGDASDAALWAQCHIIAWWLSEPDPDVRAVGAVLLVQATRYHREFGDRAWRVFPSARDRGRQRGHATRSAAYETVHVPYDVPWLRRLYGDRCLYCGVASEHIDHVQPLALGGADAPWNVAPACKSCNLSKGKKALAAWLPGRLLSVHAERARAQWAEWTAA
ncbi:HNH endonuclease [Herbihabitans rhizosphaerae]|uniref:HNH endonuclease n=1 Tax=Herbihabitans rhizosphaerae TaxID=1872711 RepID=UPI0013EEDE7A|nr:HNH endonuclease signature motif containing protein [Herbihabitans rhizosphaerae]